MSPRTWADSSFEPLPRKPAGTLQAIPPSTCKSATTGPKRSIEEGIFWDRQPNKRQKSEQPMSAYSLRYTAALLSPPGDVAHIGKGSVVVVLLVIATWRGQNAHGIGKNQDSNRAGAKRPVP